VGTIQLHTYHSLTGPSSAAKVYGYAFYYIPLLSSGLDLLFCFLPWLILAPLTSLCFFINYVSIFLAFGFFSLLAIDSVKVCNDVTETWSAWMTSWPSG
jgi:hypothetical protein